MAIMNLEKLDLSDEEESIIMRVIELDKDEINPKILTESLSYHSFEDLVEEFGLDEFQRSLRSLSEKSFLDEREYDRAIFCPQCGSIHVHSKFACPKCGSVSVVRKELIEHSHCGYIGNREKFKSDERLVCPNCKTDLGPVGGEPKESGKKKYTVIGSSFICEECGNNFDRPRVIHRCIKCGTSFNHKRARYKKLYAYKLTDKAKKASLKPETLKLINEMEKTLREEGFKVDAPGKQIGQSDVLQKFNILARRDGEILVIDVSEGSQNDLISLVGKKIDVEAEMAALVDLSGKMRQSELAENQNIALLKASQEGLQEKLLDYVKDNTEYGKGFF